MGNWGPARLVCLNLGRRGPLGPGAKPGPRSAQGLPPDRGRRHANREFGVGGDRGIPTVAGVRFLPKLFGRKLGRLSGFAQVVA